MADKDKPSFGDAIRDVENLPTNEAEIGVVATADDVGVQGRVSKTFGEAWRAGATGQWFRDKGWQVAAFLGWRGGSR